MEKILIQIEKEIKKLCNDSSHDFYHMKRTYTLALNIQKQEGGDKLIIGVAALLHDIHRIIGRQTGKFCSPKDSLKEVGKILNKLNLKDEQKKRILHCIEFHEEYDFSKNGKTTNDLETLILQDADNLDAIGAIGIIRNAIFVGAINGVMWDPKKTNYRKTFDEDKNDVTMVDHFYNKLLRLKDNMNTKTAKKIAIKRHKFMEKFLERFFSEWEGKE